MKSRFCTSIALIACACVQGLPAAAEEVHAQGSSISAGASYSSAHGALALIGAELIDVAQSGLSLSADLRKGQEGEGGTAKIRYERPLETTMLGEAARLSFGAGFVVSSWTDEPYQNRSTNLSIALDAEASDQLSYTARLFWQGDSVTNSSAKASPLVAAALGKSDAAGVTVEVHLGHVVGGVLPTAGMGLDAGVTWAGLGERKTASAFVAGVLARTIGKDTTLVLRAETGRIRGLDGQGVGLIDRAFLGGSGGPRGFGYGGIGPRDHVSGSVDMPLGGQKYATASIEVRRDLSERLSVGAFVDAGSVWDLGDAPVIGASGAIDDARNWRSSGGLAFYWDTQVGKLNLSIATPIDAREHDSFNEVSLGLLRRF